MGFTQSSESHNIIVKISRIQSKITWHLKKDENVNFHGKKQSTDAYKMTEMLELSDRDFKAAVIKSLKHAVI